MSIDVTFTISDSDLEHFRVLMDKALEVAEKFSEDEIIEKAAEECKLIESTEIPEFISSRLKNIPILIDMLKDEDWQLPEEERVAIRTALAYFHEPGDVLPDHLPVLGYLDDAIMIELVMNELTLDFTAYTEFCAFRKTETNRRGDEANVNRENWLGGKRSDLHKKIRSARKSRSGGSVFRRVF